MRARVLLVSGIALALVASAASAATLQAIAPIGADTSTQGKAITGDGKVVGTSGAAGMIWDAVNGARYVTYAGSNASNVTGVGYRTTTGGQKQLVAFGAHAGWPTTWISSDNGLTWGQVVRQTNYPSTSGFASAAYNAIGASAASDRFYTAFANSANNGDPLCADIWSGDPASVVHATKGVSGQKSSAQGVSASGLLVGRRRTDSTNYANYKVQVTPTGGTSAAAFEALNGNAPTTGNIYRGEAWAVSADGNVIAGTSPMNDDGFLHAYVAVFTGGGVTRVGAWELPLYPGSASGQPYAVSTDGAFVGGRSYAGQDRATLWDVRDPTNPVRLDLTEWFTAHGKMGPFTMLQDVYSIAKADGLDGYWLTGKGLVGSQTQAFVMFIPEPMSALMLALGGMALLRRRVR